MNLSAVGRGHGRAAGGEELHWSFPIHDNLRPRVMLAVLTDSQCPDDAIMAVRQGSFCLAKVTMAGLQDQFWLAGMILSVLQEPFGVTKVAL